MNQRNFGNDLTNHQIENYGLTTAQTQKGKFFEKENFSPNISKEFVSKLQIKPKETRYTVPDGMELSYLPLKDDMADNLRPEKVQKFASGISADMTTQASKQFHP